MDLETSIFSNKGIFKYRFPNGRIGLAFTRGTVVYIIFYNENDDTTLIYQFMLKVIKILTFIIDHTKGNIFTLFEERGQVYQFPDPFGVHGDSYLEFIRRADNEVDIRLIRSLEDDTIMNFEQLVAKLTERVVEVPLSGICETPMLMSNFSYMSCETCKTCIQRRTL